MTSQQYSCACMQSLISIFSTMRVYLVLYATRQYSPLTLIPHYVGHIVTVFTMQNDKLFVRD